MNSIIITLQNEIISSKMQLSDLLRKSLLIAKKLELKEFEKWILNELNGYNEAKDIPEYRIVRGELVAFNGYRNIPVILDSKMNELINSHKMFEPVAELESFLGSETIGSGTITIKLTGEMHEILLPLMNYPGNCIFKKVFSISQLNVILDQIKTRLLDFTLDLEKQGVLGDGIMFSNEEKQIASTFNTVNTTNTYVNAPVEYFQMQQNTKESCQNIALNENGDINQSLEKILSAIDNLGLDKENRDELYAELQTIKFQMQSSKPKNMILRESWNTARNILEGVAAGLISSGLMNHVDKITQSIKNIT